MRRHRALRRALEAGRAARLARAALGSQLRRVRLALVTAPCARIAIAGADGGVRAARGCRRRRPAAVRQAPAAARSPSPLVASDPAAGTLRVGFEVYAQRKGAQGRATRSSSAPGATASRPRPTARRVLALLEPLRERRAIVLVDARGTGRSGRVGDRQRRLRRRRGGRRSRRRARASSASGTSSSTPPATAPASRSPTPRATATGCARWCSTAGRARRCSPATAAPRRAGSPRPSARARRLVARLAARLRTRPLRVGGRIDDDALARAARGRTRARSPSCRPQPPPRSRATACRSRGIVARSAAPAQRQAAQARASNCHDDAPPVASARGGRRAVHRRDLAARPGPRRLQGLAAAGDPRSGAAGGRDARRRARARPRGRARRRARRARRCARSAGLLPSGTYVRVRGAAALPALNDPGGCAGDARARVPGDARQDRAPAARAAPRDRRRDRVPVASLASRARRAARRQCARPRSLDARRPARGHRRRAGRRRRARRRRGRRRRQRS